MSNSATDASRRTFMKAAAASSIAMASGAALANRPSPTQARGYATWKHGLVHYFDNGAKGFPLLLMHQTPMTARQFEAVYAPLAQRGVRAIGIDSPGFGGSDPTPFVPAIADWVPAVVAVMDHLKISQSDALGHHTGGLLATELALQHPKRVRNLVLNGPYPINEEERQAGLDNVRKREMNYEYKADGTHLTETFMARMKVYGPGADSLVTTRVVVEKFQGFGPFWYGHNAAYRYDHAATLMRLKHRTLLLTNTGDKIFHLAQRAHQLRPDFEYVELPGGSVDIVQQQPEAWSDVVTRFLAGKQR